LDLFYSDPQRYAYTFQSYAFLSRMRAQMQPFSEFEDQLKRGPPRPVTQSSSSSASEDTKGLEEPSGDAEQPSAPSEQQQPEQQQQQQNSTAKRPREQEGADAQGTTDAAGGEAGQPPSKRHHTEQLPVVQFFERSVFSDRYCFAHNCWQAGLFSDLEWGIYRDWHHWLTHAFPQLKLDGLVYLRTDPKTCEQRLHKRDRREESEVPLEYLEQIHKRHEDWLIHKAEHVKLSDLVKDVPILVLECDQEFEAEPKRRQEMLRQISQFVDKLNPPK
jgi:deoxyadenosine/deoxycytidine kinase